jgi:hypothetical protein
LGDVCVVIAASHFFSTVSESYAFFNDRETAGRVLTTFLKWHEAAVANKVEPFEKEIAPEFWFQHSGNVSTLGFYPHGRAEQPEKIIWHGDVEKFVELLKLYPEAKAELDAKVRKAASEASLFETPEK